MQYLFLATFNRAYEQQKENYLKNTKKIHQIFIIKNLILKVNLKKLIINKKAINSQILTKIYKENSININN